jgi:hypothetical protein
MNTDKPSTDTPAIDKPFTDKLVGETPASETQFSETPATDKLTPSPRPLLSTPNVNHWFAAALTDPARKAQLKHDWVGLLLTEIEATPQQQASLRSLPPADAKELQAVIAQVAEHGGTIHVDRPSETGPGMLVVQPAHPGGPAATHGGPAATHGGPAATHGGPAPEAAVAGGGAAGLSVGIFHCTFDAHCRHWHCAWGPAKKQLAE